MDPKATNPFELAVAERLKSMQKDVDHIRTRVKWLLTLLGQGREFLVIFPRQSGKDEAITQLLTYLLKLFQGAGICVIYGATGGVLGLGLDRLEDRLDNAWNAGAWLKTVRAPRRCLGKACVDFVSSHPSASARGEDAQHLLVIDETQGQLGSHVESVFTPMRAANNATALYVGTVKLTPDQITTENPPTRNFSIPRLPSTAATVPSWTVSTCLSRSMAAAASSTTGARPQCAGPTPAHAPPLPPGGRGGRGERDREDPHAPNSDEYSTPRESTNNEGG